jgi:hypothetical protein
VSSPTPLELTLLPGARELLALQARELPQRDDLCGAFCGALALRAAGVITSPGGGGGGEKPLDQDAVALAAGSVVCEVPDPGCLPAGERGRRDYRLKLPFVADAAVSGTTAAGLLDAIERLSSGALAAVPFGGPWTAHTLDGLFERAAACEHPVTLIANLATRHLWGSHPHAEQVLSYLLDGVRDGPPPDWEVGHFVCVVGFIVGPGGSLYAVADTYPSLGRGGVHLQPREHLAAAIERREGPAGGVLAVVSAQDAPALRAGAAELGLNEEIWDNGTVTPESTPSSGPATTPHAAGAGSTSPPTGADHDPSA